ncbi:MAG: polysaccharide deacetylase family protein [Elusimicrobiota bacterium]|jgi:peptidoglycan/xylan/chitin deacetylase (PgdA/CDA1 family)
MIFLLVLPSAFAYTPGKFYFTGHTKEKLIALTFDDGPGPFTPKILDLLKQHNARATFFMEGDLVPSHAAIAKQVAEAGHEIGNHTWRHLDFHKIKEQPAERLAQELARAEEAIQQATGVQARVVRMPHGYYNKTWLLPTLKEHGYALVHWTFGTDWFLKKTPEQMADEYLKNAHPGAIFLFHDGGRHREKTLAALQIILSALEQQGYRFVAAEDLLKNDQ